MKTLQDSSNKSSKNNIASGEKVSSASSSVTDAAACSGAVEISKPLHSGSPLENQAEKASLSDDPKALNKFSNDGSFLATILAKSHEQEHNRKKAVPDTAANRGALTSTKRHGKPGSAGSNQQQASVKKWKQSAKPGGSGEKNEDNQPTLPVYEDETDIRAREEFLRTMKIMEEAGLVTEKGIGAGMVK